VLAYTARGNGIASEPVVVSTDEDSKFLYLWELSLEKL
jgi:hypothetical protein